MPRDSDNNGFGEWGGYMEAKIVKLGEQFSAASDPFRKSTLFGGISIFVNGRTDPSADELKRIMMIHGGTYHHYELSSTTFIIASNLPDVKVRNMNTSKIISANWVVDCVKAGRIVDYTRYLLYTNRNTTQPKICFNKAKTDHSLEQYNNNNTVVASTEEKNDGNIVKNLQALATAFTVPALINKVENTVNLDAQAATDSPISDDNEHSVQLVKSDVNESIVDVKPMEAAHEAFNHSITNTSVASSSSHTKSSVARTAVDPKFLNEFFNNSRLHHIATLGAGFKQYISELRERHNDAGFPERQHLKNALLSQGIDNQKEPTTPCVMHIDMDCFFVSVGLRTRPHLRDKPVAVTHSKGGAGANDVPVHQKADRAKEMELFAKRFEQHLHSNVLTDKVRSGFGAKMSLSEIASCSYAAREKGIRNGMFVGQALQLCPELVTIPYDFEAYKEVAFTLYNTIAEYTLNIEAVSCDEMFVDLCDVLSEIQVSPMCFVKAVREKVFERTGCPCSAGVGANRLQARMATKRAKPNGQFHLLPNNVQSYMADIPISELPGVGSSTTYTLKNANLYTCGDMQQVTLTKIQMLVGKKFGEQLFNFCRGKDNRPLTYEQVRKSVSAEVNYGIRFKDNDEMEKFVRQLCEEVHKRLLDIKRKTKSITLKVMVRAKEAPIETSKFMGHGVCDNITKTTTLTEYTNSIEVITRNVLVIMKSLKIPPNELRGIGVQLARLDDVDEQQQQQQKDKKNSAIMTMFSKVAENQKKAIQQTTDQKAKLAAAVALADCNSVMDTKLENQAIEKPDEIAAITTTKTTTKRKFPISSAPNDANVLLPSTKGNSQPNVMAMLKALPAKKRKTNLATTADTCAALEIPDRIDAEVFKALPVEIRKEIIASVAKAKKTPTIMATNVGAATEAKTTTTNHSLLIIPENIDPEVVKALPPEIRQEIIASVPREPVASTMINANIATTTAAAAAASQYNKNPNYSVLNESDFLPSTSKAATQKRLRQISEKTQKVQNDVIDEAFLPPLPPDVRPAKENHLKCQYAATTTTTAKPASNNCITSIPIGTIIDWIASSNQPNPLDIGMLAEHCCSLVQTRQISTLLDKLLRLSSLIKRRRKQNCYWHNAFATIMQAVNEEMQVVYNGKKLYIAPKFNCDKCAELVI